MKVSNRKCVRHLAWKSLLASRTRNLIAIVAIALTTMLFTSLFTIALSINDGFQQSNFRQVGGFSHGGFKYLTEEQAEDRPDDATGQCSDHHMTVFRKIAVGKQRRTGSDTPDQQHARILLAAHHHRQQEARCCSASVSPAWIEAPRRQIRKIPG